MRINLAFVREYCARQQPRGVQNRQDIPSFIEALGDHTGTGLRFVNASRDSDSRFHSVLVRNLLSFMRRTKILAGRS